MYELECNIDNLRMKRNYLRNNENRLERIYREEKSKSTIKESRKVNTKYSIQSRQV